MTNSNETHWIFGSNSTSDFKPQAMGMVAKHVNWVLHNLKLRKPIFLHARNYWRGKTGRIILNRRVTEVKSGFSSTIPSAQYGVIFYSIFTSVKCHVCHRSYMLYQQMIDINQLVVLHKWNLNFFSLQIFKASQFTKKKHCYINFCSLNNRQLNNVMTDLDQICKLNISRKQLITYLKNLHFEYYTTHLASMKKF